MGTGYTRNDTANNIADGNVINASDLDGEFDAVQAAFNASTGHSHDGTTGEGPQIDASGIANNAVALGTKTTGNYVATLTAGALIDLQNNSGEGATPTIDVDLTELTDMTETAVGADELVILDGGTAQKRKAISEIPLSIFNNDSSFSTTTGTVTSVGTTGTVNGITLTGTVTSSGNLTLGGTLGNITFSQLDGGAVTTSSESFADNDTTLMTSAAINDRIESFGYTTNTGDVTLAGSQELTNKTIDVDNNTVSNIEVDNFKSGVLDTDISSVAATDTTLASAKAIKTYVDAQVAGSGMSNLVEDTSPQLGGNLDLNSKTINGSGTINYTGSLTQNGNTNIYGGTLKLNGSYNQGTENSVLGEDAMQNGMDSGVARNVAIGFEAGKHVNSALFDDNTIIGHSALLGVQDNANSSHENVAIGSSALKVNLSGDDNVAIGYKSMTASTGTDGNTAVGHLSLFNFDNSSGGTGKNTAVGSNAGNAITTGAKNTLIGCYDGNSGGLDIRTSDNNVVLSDGDGNIRLYVDSGGAVGIGTTVPLAKLDVGGSVRTDAGSTSTPAILLDDTNTGFYKAATNEIGMVTDGTERVRIDSSGAVGIGTTSPTGTALSLKGSLPPLVIDNNSAVDSAVFKNTVRFRDHEGNTVANISMHEAAVQYNTSSDHRLKENVESMTGAISRVKQLAPKRFSWIAANLDAPNVDGFMAHEAQTVVPEAVSGTHNEVDDDGNAVMQGIDHSKLVPLLTGALQEAIAKIETLETKVAVLEACS